MKSYTKNEEIDAILSRFRPNWIKSEDLKFFDDYVLFELSYEDIFGDLSFRFSMDFELENRILCLSKLFDWIHACRVQAEGSIKQERSK